jgi:hypothetical protein
MDALRICPRFATVAEKIAVEYLRHAALLARTLSR